jgi:hypothetical protein
MSDIDDVDLVSVDLSKYDNLEWAAEPVVLYADSIEDLTVEFQEELQDDYGGTPTFNFADQEDESRIVIDIRYTKSEVTTPPVKEFLSREDPDFEFSVREEDELFVAELEDPSVLETLSIISYDPETNKAVLGSPKGFLPAYYDNMETA